ncbi:MAG TPA: low molecular weight protein-tyrosine-phosphatase [Acidimicrobiales bacterium]|nr:low molecular weight protein-tyrosine-phosphatase [Acidimicrobiales bacterium]
MTDQTIRIAMICTGNICRSPMAEVALRHLVAEDPFLVDHVIVTSAGTANWHVGDPMDHRARRALDEAGYLLEGTPAAFADADYLNAHNIVVVMTREHVDEVSSRLTNERTEVIMLRNLLEPGLDLDVSDPYYGTIEDFRQCLDVLISAGQRLTSEFRLRLGADSREA